MKVEVQTNTLNQKSDWILPITKELLRVLKQTGTFILNIKEKVVDGERNTYVIGLRGIPKEAWEYKLGNRSALEWILDQYKEKKPKDPTIAEKFNTYKFADYKEKVIDLLERVCGVSVGTDGGGGDGDGLDLPGF